MSWARSYAASRGRRPVKEKSIVTIVQRVVVCLLAAGTLIGATACAPVVVRRDDRGRDYRADGERRAFANGQNEGLKHGRSDARKGHRFEYEEAGEYRSADKGYSKRDGDLDDYRAAFRRGFVVGYSDAYKANESNADRRSRRR